MSQREAAAHWSSDKVWDRRRRIKRRSATECPYSVTIKIGDEDWNRLDELKSYLGSIMDDVSWENQSMLIRQAIKMACAKMGEEKGKNQKPVENETVVKV